MLLPTPLLLIIASFESLSIAFEVPWLRHGATANRLVEAKDHTLRDGHSIEDSARPVTPVGVRKMSHDQGEMFFPSYWTFEVESETLPNPALGKRKSESSISEAEELNEHVNFTTGSPLQAPFSLHTSQQFISKPHLLRMPRAIFSLDQRDFQCPTDTSACTSINKPDSCCPSDSICQLIADSGQGDVGCCAAGQSCSQQVSKCQAGYASCPGSSGGGCCVPGYSCMGVGCTSHLIYGFATYSADPLGRRCNILYCNSDSQPDSDTSSTIQL